MYVQYVYIDSEIQAWPPMGREEGVEVGTCSPPEFR
jgi:hypothetical protein